ncbi:MAG: ABC transporter ATP-binding protein [Janthinobacterium lividum]
MTPAISILKLHKTYASGFKALDCISLDIAAGEIFALLGPNGAGKSTLIGVVCGLIKASSGTVTVDGQRLPENYREARGKIGLVPQELVNEGFESVWSTVRFSRGLFGKPHDPALLERLLKELSLWEKRDVSTLQLSGGMRRRVMIAKALAHEPTILFLDEPSAGVDVELRKAMWAVILRLRDRGVTVVLTTHYLEEAEQMADRIGVINDGRLLLVEDKTALIKRLGRRLLHVSLAQSLSHIPSALAGEGSRLANHGQELVVTIRNEQNGVAQILSHLAAANIAYSDLRTSESTLEDIFITLTQRSP